MLIMETSKKCYDTSEVVPLKCNLVVLNFTSRLSCFNILMSCLSGYRLPSDIGSKWYSLLVLYCWPCPWCCYVYG